MDYLKPVIENALANADSSGAVRGEDGILRCAVCGGEREFRLPDGTTVPCMCRCRMERWEEEEKRRRAREALRSVESLGELYDRSFAPLRFEADRWPERPASRLARSYAARFGEIRAKGLGLLLCGPVGTGKSFLAACIVNAVREQGFRALILSTTRLVTVLQGSRERQSLIDRLAALDLLALDDLGAERSSDYAIELLENLLDIRARWGKTMIVTTNLNRQELSEPRDQRYARLFDRVRELCPEMQALTGASLRGARSRERGKELGERISRA